MFGRRVVQRNVILDRCRLLSPPSKHITTLWDHSLEDIENAQLFHHIPLITRISSIFSR